MMITRRNTYAIATIAAILTFTPSPGEQWFWQDEPVPAIEYAITEDDPRWNCATMGNRVCGPTITPDGYESDTGEYVGGHN